MCEISLLPCRENGTRRDELNPVIEGRESEEDTSVITTVSDMQEYATDRKFG